MYGSGMWRKLGGSSSGGKEEGKKWDLGERERGRGFKHLYL